MADREKLIELLIQADDMCLGTSCPKCEYYRQPECRYKLFADHLIDNSETVRERGRWEDEHGGKYANPRYRCPVCKGRALYKFERDLLDNWKEVQALTDFCPNCGADMR